MGVIMLTNAGHNLDETYVRPHLPAVMAMVKKVKDANN